MARRNEHSPAQIKEMVLNAAEKRVIEYGLSGLKMREIAMDIGYTVASIYMAFKNIADLILHVRGRTLDELTLQLEEIPHTDDIEQQINLLATAYLTFAQHNYYRWRMLFETHPSEAQTVPAWYQEKINRSFTHIEQLFQQLAPETSATEQKIAAQALWSGIHGVCLLKLTAVTNAEQFEHINKTLLVLVESFIKGWKMQNHALKSAA